MADSILTDDAPWRRLPWSLPVGALLTLLALVGLVRLLAEAPLERSKPPALSAQILELPAPGPAASAAAAAPEPQKLPPPPDLVTPKSRGQAPTAASARAKAATAHGTGVGVFRHGHLRRDRSA